jgi:hypothetical protein
MSQIKWPEEPTWKVEALIDHAQRSDAGVCNTVFLMM